MQRRRPTDPVVRRDGRATVALVHVDRDITLPHRDVHRLAQSGSQRVAELRTLAGDVESAAHRAGQPQDAGAEAVPAAFPGRFDEAASVQHAEQPGCGGLVHADGRRRPRTPRRRRSWPGTRARSPRARRTGRPRDPGRGCSPRNCRPGAGADGSIAGAGAGRHSALGTPGSRSWWAARLLRRVARSGRRVACCTMIDFDWMGRVGDRAGASGEQLRLRHRRRRQRRVRPGRAADRRRRPHGAGAGGRPQRLPLGPVHPDAGRPHLSERQPVLRLALRVGARAVHERPPDRPRQGQGARRLQFDQRDDLPARQPDGLPALGRRPRDGGLGLGALPAVLPADGELPGRRSGRPVARAFRTAGAGARTGPQPVVRCVLRGRGAGRLPADRRRERLPAGRLRRLRPQCAPRAPALGLPGLPTTGDVPVQPDGAHPGIRHRHHHVRDQGHRRALPPQRPHPTRWTPAR